MRLAIFCESMKPDGYVITEGAVQTTENVKVPDVAWISFGASPPPRPTSLPTRSPRKFASRSSRPSNMPEEQMHKGRLYLQAGAEEFWLCNELGDVRFFDAAGPLERSRLCPEFPAKVEFPVVLARFFDTWPRRPPGRSAPVRSASRRRWRPRCPAACPRTPGSAPVPRPSAARLPGRCPARACRCTTSSYVTTAWKCSRMPSASSVASTSGFSPPDATANGNRPDTRRMKSTTGSMGLTCGMSSPKSASLRSAVSTTGIVQPNRALRTSTTAAAGIPPSE